MYEKTLGHIDKILPLIPIEKNKNVCFVYVRNISGLVNNVFINNKLNCC